MTFQAPQFDDQHHRDIVPAALLAALVWLAYFQLCSGLGLYQDDAFMYHIVHDTRDGVLREAFDLSRSYGGEGRPATQVVMVLFTWAGTALGGVTGLYVLGWLILSLAALAMYGTLRELFPAGVSFIAAAVYALYPADAAKFFAVSYMSNFGALLFWLSARLLLRRRPIAAAVLIASTFLMGEAYILPALALPLLALADARRSLRDAGHNALRFGLAYALIILPAIAWRLAYAPGRAAEAMGQQDRLGLVAKMFASMYFGVAASASSFATRAQEFIGGRSSSGLTTAFIVAVAVLACAWWLMERSSTLRIHTAGSVAREVRPALLLAFGLLAWASTYPLYGLYPARYPPNILTGKLSNVHAQGAIGVTVLVACGFWALQRRFPANPLPRLAAAAIALLLGTYAGYFAQVQQRYVDDWRFQLSFWRQLPDVVPDLKPTSLVVVDAVGAEAGRLEGASSFDWTLPYLYPWVWQPPPGSAQLPLFMSRYFYDTTVKEQDDHLLVTGYPTLPDRTFAKSDLVRLRVESGRLARVDRPKAARSTADVALFDESLASLGWAPGPLLLRAASVRELRVVPNDYSEGGWSHGVAVRPSGGGRMFYFLLKDRRSNPIQRGSTLRFAHTGLATVTQVDVSPQGEVFAIFVAVDRDLDPDRDGYPNAVVVVPSGN